MCRCISFPGTFVISCLLCLPALNLGAPRAAAGDEVSDYLATVAVRLGTLLKEKGETKVGISFSGPPSFRSAGGEGLVQVLTDKLRHEGITVADRAAYGFKGEFKPKLSEEGRPGSLALQISGQITDQLGDPVAGEALDCLVTNPRKVSEILGLTVDLNPPNRKDPGAELVSSFRNPSLFIREGRQARPGRNSLFGLEVLAGKPAAGSTSVLEGKAGRAIKERDQLGYVDLDLGEEYALRLTNDAPYEVAVSVAVDGLSIFHFCEERSADPQRQGEPRYSYYIIGPGKSAVVGGWFKNTNRNIAFQVTPLEQGAAYKLGQTGKIGTISATFHASWEKGQVPPADEKKIEKVEPVTVMRYVERIVIGPDGKPRVEKVQVMETRTVVSTGFGRDLITSTVGVSRTIGIERGTITLRYQRPSSK